MTAVHRHRWAEAHRADAQETLEELSNAGSFRLIYEKLAVLNVVAERRPAAHPDAFFARGRELIADTLADHLAFELRKGQQDIEGEPAH